jgi:hypothetical protein
MRVELRDHLLGLFGVLRAQVMVFAGIIGQMIKRML